MASIGPVDPNWAPSEIKEQASKPEQIRALLSIWDQGIINRFEFESLLLRISRGDWVT